MRPLDQFVLLACVTATISAAVEAGDVPLANARATLGELSRRLQGGDRAAIDDLLARTKPASADLADASARAEVLRTEIDRLRGVQVPRLAPAHPVQPVAETEPTRASFDPLREARAWLYAGEPANALKVVPDGDGEAAYWRGRALEKLGREPEALEAYNRAAAADGVGSPAAGSAPVIVPSWKAWAAADAAHLTWKARVAPGAVKP